MTNTESNFKNEYNNANTHAKLDEIVKNMGIGAAMGLYNSLVVVDECTGLDMRQVALKRALKYKIEAIDNK